MRDQEIRGRLVHALREAGIVKNPAGLADAICAAINCKVTNSEGRHHSKFHKVTSAPEPASRESQNDGASLHSGDDVPIRVTEADGSKWVDAESFDRLELQSKQQAATIAQMSEAVHALDGASVASQRSREAMSDIIQRLKDSKPDNSICEHGSQKRKCPICERDAEIEALSDAMKAANDEALRLRAALLEHACHCGPTDPDPMVHREDCAYRAALAKLEEKKP